MSFLNMLPLLVNPWQVLICNFLVNVIVLYVHLYQVFDGDNIHFPLVGTFCGTSIPSYFLSNGNLLTIHFATDSSVERRGFNATYSAVPCKTISTFYYAALYILKKQCLFSSAKL